MGATLPDADGPVKTFPAPGQGRKQPREGDDERGGLTMGVSGGVVQEETVHPF